MVSRLDQINRKITQLEQQKEALQKSLSQDHRKERTRRLIQIGALAEKYFDLYGNTIDETEEIFAQFASFVKANKLDKHK